MWGFPLRRSARISHNLEISENKGLAIRSLTCSINFARFSGYFGSELPFSEGMSYGELREHINGLRSSGVNVTEYLVQLHRKLAFPFITLIMALIAVPFAVTTGKRGAMYGVGAGIVLAILYWTAISVFAGVGSAGLMSPVLAAWAPNLVFGSVALYLLFTVKT